MSLTIGAISGNTSYGNYASNSVTGSSNLSDPLLQFSNLQLTAEQQAQLKTIFSNAQNSSASQDDIRKKVSSVLTTQQQTTLHNDLQSQQSQGSGAAPPHHHRHHSSTDSTTSSSDSANSLDDDSLVAGLDLLPSQTSAIQSILQSSQGSDLSPQQIQQQVALVLTDQQSQPLNPNVDVGSLLSPASPQSEATSLAHQSNIGTQIANIQLLNNLGQ